MDQRPVAPSEIDWAAEFDRWSEEDAVLRRKRLRAASIDRATRRFAGALLLLLLIIAAFQLSRLVGLIPLGALI